MKKLVREKKGRGTERKRSNKERKKEKISK